MASLSPAFNQSNPYQKIRPADRTRITRLQYPEDIGKYYIAFEFAEYGPQYNSGIADLINLPGVSAAVQAGIALSNTPVLQTIGDFLGLDLSISAERAQKTTYGIGGVNAAIALPMPPNLLDDQQLDYNAQNLKNVAAQAVSAATNINTAGGAVASAAETFVSVFSGQTVNPFLAMMFNGPRFKTHQFGWRFSPKNATETDTLVEIINTFKANALPVQTASGGLFQYPSVVKIALYPDNTRNRTYLFKPAVITQVSIHYAPSGTPSFFAGTEAPVEIELKLQLSEISIWTNNDFVQGPQKGVFD